MTSNRRTNNSLSGFSFMSNQRSAFFHSNPRSQNASHSSMQAPSHSTTSSSLPSSVSYFARTRWQSETNSDSSTVITQNAKSSSTSSLNHNRGRSKRTAEVRLEELHFTGEIHSGSSKTALPPPTQPLPKPQSPPPPQPYLVDDSDIDGDGEDDDDVFLPLEDDDPSKDPVNILNVNDEEGTGQTLSVYTSIIQEAYALLTKNRKQQMIDSNQVTPEFILGQTIVEQMTNKGVEMTEERVIESERERLRNGERNVPLSIYSENSLRQQFSKELDDRALENYRSNGQDRVDTLANLKEEKRRTIVRLYVYVAECIQYHKEQLESGRDVGKCHLDLSSGSSLQEVIDQLLRWILLSREELGIHRNWDERILGKLPRNRKNNNKIGPISLRTFRSRFKSIIFPFLKHYYRNTKSGPIIGSELTLGAVRDVLTGNSVIEEAEYLTGDVELKHTNPLFPQDCEDMCGLLGFGLIHMCRRAYLRLSSLSLMRLDDILTLRRRDFRVACSVAKDDVHRHEQALLNHDFSIYPSLQVRILNTKTHSVSRDQWYELPEIERETLIHYFLLLDGSLEAFFRREFLDTHVFVFNHCEDGTYQTTKYRDIGKEINKPLHNQRKGCVHKAMMSMSGAVGAPYRHFSLHGVTLAAYVKAAVVGTNRVVWSRAHQTYIIQRIENANQEGAVNDVARGFNRHSVGSDIPHKKYVSQGLVYHIKGICQKKLEALVDGGKVDMTTVTIDSLFDSLTVQELHWEYERGTQHRLTSKYSTGQDMLRMEIFSNALVSTFASASIFPNTFLLDSHDKALFLARRFPIEMVRRGTRIKPMWIDPRCANQRAFDCFEIYVCESFLHAEGAPSTGTSFERDSFLRYLARMLRSLVALNLLGVSPSGLTITWPPPQEWMRKDLYRYMNTAILGHSLTHKAAVLHEDFIPRLEVILPDTKKHQLDLLNFIKNRKENMPNTVIVVRRSDHSLEEVHIGARIRKDLTIQQARNMERDLKAKGGKALSKE